MTRGHTKKRRWRRQRYADCIGTAARNLKLRRYCAGDWLASRLNRVLKVAPDRGGDIIMGKDEVIAFARIATGLVIANHLEALSHCPVRRADLRQAADGAGIGARLCIPQDGDTIDIARHQAAA